MSQQQQQHLWEAAATTWHTWQGCSSWQQVLAPQLERTAAAMVATQAIRPPPTALQQRLQLQPHALLGAGQLGVAWYVATTQRHSLSPSMCLLLLLLLLLLVLVAAW
jgi:hypothetical protein